MKYFTYLIIAIVAVAIIAGFFIVGSPRLERERRFDETRLNDLQSIQNEVLFYWQSKQKIPSALNDLVSPLRGFKPPQDPETGAAYEYSTKGDKTFSLCAVFALDSSPDMRTAPDVVPENLTVPDKGLPGPIIWNWEHKAGRSCFDRTIDPDFYPPLNSATKK